MLEKMMTEKVATKKITWNAQKPTGIQAGKPSSNLKPQSQPQLSILHRSGKQPPIPPPELLSASTAFLIASVDMEGGNHTPERKPP
mmetsp:Transcript_34146/g.133678  ORF Transcript_34146/g.133678 Transcript_34146/m.133678 type:complete len:86 (+) Transcript_34146:658-915(+)